MHVSVNYLIHSTDSNLMIRIFMLVLITLNIFWMGSNLKTAPNLNFMDPSFPPDPNIGSIDPRFGKATTEGESSDNDLSDTLLNIIRQTLIDEDLEEKSCMFHDPLALQAAEKSFYEILGQKQPLSPHQPPLYSESPEKHSNNSSSSTSNPVDRGEYTPSYLQSNPVEYTLQSHSVDSLLPFNILSDPESFLEFKKGVEEGEKFLPKGNTLIAPEKKGETGKDEREYFPTASRGRKNRQHEDTELEDGRSNKQCAVYVEEELSELFDKAVLYDEQTQGPMCMTNGLSKNEETNNLQQGVKGRGRKQNSEIEVVDLRTLLIRCAQAVSINDRRAVNELLKQIRQHSSPTGDGSQRLAHYFANSLEARLAGTGPQLYTGMASKKSLTSAILKAFHLYASTCPFLKISIFFANYSIRTLAKNVTSLHIIDFGIQYGFQWPVLFQFLSVRPGGPPKIRITGIELPQSGFRPAAGVEETGRRLAKYCERFNVPFEYNPIAQKWETIRVEDLKIHKDEMLVVNSLFRFENLLDETVVVNCPRNAVLNLIRKIKPDLFVQAIASGALNVPFFVTRFREAVFYFSSLFDIFDAIVPRDDQDRLMCEREFVGREIMSVIACEGSERVVRPETFKQWQLRNVRAGFRQLPLNNELIKDMRVTVMPGYHPDFVVNEDGGWLLQGWKGRVLYGISCWVPT